MSNTAIAWSRYAARGRAWSYLNDVSHQYLVPTSPLDARHPARSDPSNTPQWHIIRKFTARNFWTAFRWPWGAFTDCWYLLLCRPDWHRHTEAISMSESMSRIRQVWARYSECHNEIRCPQLLSWWALFQTWNTGPLFGDSCGYIALSHLPSAPRIIVAFRGTYSITNTIIDLATLPQEYVPYPGDDGDEKNVLWAECERCPGCTVHAGFIASWRETRDYVTPYLEELIEKYPKYQLTLVGHSLGGALAALASLEYHYRGWTPQVTTFGEPRIGNIALMQHFDRAFPTHKQPDISSTYRRVTHAGDPVPLLPISEWGYRMHGGEIYISKSDIPPAIKDLQPCVGDEDPECIAGRQALGVEITAMTGTQDLNYENFLDWWTSCSGTLPIPPRFKVWQLFFAHRDYFWRLGLCIPGGDPWNWYKKPQQVYAAEERY